MVPSNEVPDWGIGGVVGGALDVECFLEALRADARHPNARVLLGLEYLTMLRIIILFRKKINESNCRFDSFGCLSPGFHGFASGIENALTPIRSR
jgi:hypothetical protein